MTEVQTPSLLTVREAAQRVGISCATLRREVQAGRIVAVRPAPHALRIPTTEIERLLTPVQAGRGEG